MKCQSGDDFAPPGLDVDGPFGTDASVQLKWDKCDGGVMGGQSRRGERAEEDIFGPSCMSSFSSGTKSKPGYQ